jgi:hypothetical protein
MAGTPRVLEGESIANLASRPASDVSPSVVGTVPAADAVPAAEALPARDDGPAQTDAHPRTAPTPIQTRSEIVDHARAPGQGNGQAGPPIQPAQAHGQPMQHNGQPGQGDRGPGCTAPQLRRFIKSRPYVPMHELRRRFGIDGQDDDVTGVAMTIGRIYVGLPEREGALLGELLRGGEIGYELSLDPRTPIVIGVYPMRPVPRA